MRKFKFIIEIILRLVALAFGFATLFYAIAWINNEPYAVKGVIICTLCQIVFGYSAHKLSAESKEPYFKEVNAFFGINQKIDQKF